VATLRLDDRGVGESAGDANAATAEDTAADAEAALTFLRARPEIDPRHVGLIGHSYGGEIAPMVAAEDPAVAAVVLMAGPARPFRETMRYQNRYRIENDPPSPPKTARKRSRMRDGSRRPTWPPAPRPGGGRSRTVIRCPPPAACTCPS
jgi:dipeptidyl aminopeptidase/acylaminoacyl peptidase